LPPHGKPFAYHMFAMEAPITTLARLFSIHGAAGTRLPGNQFGTASLCNRHIPLYAPYTSRALNAPISVGAGEAG